MMDLRDLMLNGYIIYEIGCKYLLKKVSVAKNKCELICSDEFETFDAAIEFASNHMQKQLQQITWLPTVRFDQGLGIEHRNLHEVYGPDKETALEKAKVEATRFFEKYFPTCKILEVKVRPK